MGLIGTLIIGGIVGWLASMVMKTNAQMGMIANILVGVIGASLGSWLSVQFGVDATGIMSWVMAIVGASILIGLLRLVGVFK